jgi:hypothetical protein
MLNTLADHRNAQSETDLFVIDPFKSSLPCLTTKPQPRASGTDGATGIGSCDRLFGVVTFVSVRINNLVTRFKYRIAKFPVHSLQLLVVRAQRITTPFEPLGTNG